jgi:hypothetical protein
MTLYWLFSSMERRVNALQGFLFHAVGAISANLKRLSYFNPRTWWEPI